MSRKALAILFFWIIGLNVIAQKNGTVILTGVAKNFDNQIEVEDYSEIGVLRLPTYDHLFIPDSNGHFTISFSLKSPNYFRIGRNILYLSPGDRLSVFIDFDDPKHAIFKGTHSLENDYLRNTPFPKAGSFLASGDSIKQTIQKTVDCILISAGNRQRELTADKGLSKEFIELENGRIRADIVRSLISMEAYYPYKKKFTEDSLTVFAKDYKENIVPYINHYTNALINPDLLKLDVYRGIAYHFVPDYKGPDSVASHQIMYWLKAYDLVKEMHKTNDKARLKDFLPAIDSISNTNYHNAVRRTYDDLIKFGKGDKAINFIATNLKGEPVSLNSFAGKIIYIDLWATWCGPCLNELKYLERIKQTFKDNNNIVFVSLSIDDDRNAWLKSVDKRQASGIQLIINNKQLLPYIINGIPRTIIIDKQFKIVDMYGLKPSDNKTIDYLNSLLATAK